MTMSASDVYDSKGNKVDIKSQIQKNSDGKFTITLLPDSVTSPGLYKLKATFTVNGETHVVEDEFAWGLVSLNTKKSTYKPGDTAEFVIVVLDAEGHPISDASLLMNVIDPNSAMTQLISGNGIESGSEVGLYDATYVTGIEGTYNIDIIAQANGIDTSFSTTFDVASFVEFDIIRTAQSKIDPVNNPNSFDVVIDIESFVNVNNIKIVETVPVVFEIITDGQVAQVGQQKIITWNKNLNGNQTAVGYTYSVPLVFPQLYPLGPLKINYGNNLTFTEARSWFVANDPVTKTTTGTMAGMATTTPQTFQINTSTDDANDAVFVGVAIDSASGATVSTVMYGGNSGCNTVSAESLVNTGITAATNGDSRAEIWYITNPTNHGASCDVTIAVGGTFNSFGGGAWYLADVDGSSPISETPTSTIATLTFSDVSADNILLGMMSQQRDSTATGSGGSVIDCDMNIGAGTKHEAVCASRDPSASTPVTLVVTLAKTATLAFLGVEVAVVSGDQTQPLSDSIAVTDVLVSSAVLTQSLSDSVSVTDNITTSAAQTKSLSDSVSVTDNITTSAAQTKSLSDSVSVTDNITTSAAQTKSLSDSY